MESIAPLVLACDTSQAACSVALVQGAPENTPQNIKDIIVHAAMCQPAQKSAAQKSPTQIQKGHAEALIPMMQKIMAEAAQDFAALDGLAVTIGPGTFTGVRVGLSAMRGLAVGLAKPLIGVGTLQAMAQAVIPEANSDTAILVAVDARRDTYYCQLFDTAKTPLCVPQALSGQAVLHLLATQKSLGDRVALVGTGKENLMRLAKDMNKKLYPSMAADFPLAENVARLALAQPIKNWPDILPDPLYLRPPDAALPNPAHQLRRTQKAPS